MDDGGHQVDTCYALYFGICAAVLLGWALANDLWLWALLFAAVVVPCAGHLWVTSLRPWLWPDGRR